MGRYRKVEVSTWTDEKFVDLSPMPPSGQGLWIYLLTGPHTSVIPGLCRAGRASLAESLNWELEAFDKAFREAFDKGMAKADWRAKVLWLPKAIFYNPPASPNVVKGWIDELEFIPPCDLKNEAIESIKCFLSGLGESFIAAFKTSRKTLPKPSIKTSRKTLPNQEQEQEQELREREAHELIADPLDVQVDRIWSTYPTANVDGVSGQISHADQTAICEALVRDGFDLVMAGVRNYRDAVERWPPGRKRFIRPAYRFFAASDYRKDPEIWNEGSHGTHPSGISKVEARKQRAGEVFSTLEARLYGDQELGGSDLPAEAVGDPGRRDHAADMDRPPVIIPPGRA